MNRPAATNGEAGACILTPENMHTADDCTMHDHEPTIEGRTTWQVNVFANDGDEGPSDSWIIENRTEDEATREAAADIPPDCVDWTLVALDGLES